MLSFLYVYSDHSILECYNLFSGVELSMRSFFVIPEDIRMFQKTLQYARSKVDYVISEFIYMLPSNMNLRIGKVKDCNNKILISSPTFKK